MDTYPDEPPESCPFGPSHRPRRWRAARCVQSDCAWLAIWRALRNIESDPVWARAVADRLWKHPFPRLEVAPLGAAQERQ